MVGPGGAWWRSNGYGQGLVHRVDPAVNEPINGSVGVCHRVCAVRVVTWEKVSDNFRHFATVGEVCDNFRLIATILDL